MTPPQLPAMPTVPPFPAPTAVPATPAAIWPIRLLALDIDGTLIEDDGVIGERTIRAVQAAMDLGVLVIVATGRMPSSAMGYVDALRIHGPLLAYQGALIRADPDPAHARKRGTGLPLGRIVSHTPMTAEVARDIVVWVRGRNLDPHLNHLERFILRADDPGAEDYSRFNGVSAELAADLATAITHPITKILAAGEAEDVAAAFGPATEQFAGRAAVTVSHPRFLEFLAPGVSKGRALRRVARRAGIPLGQVMAIGDQRNDLEMIAAVGHGVAMPSAPAEVLAIARYIAEPVGDEGAAQMIERLVLGPNRAHGR